MRLALPSRHIVSTYLTSCWAGSRDAAHPLEIWVRVRVVLVEKWKGAVDPLSPIPGILRVVIPPHDAIVFLSRYRQYFKRGAYAPDILRREIDPDYGAVPWPLPYLFLWSAARPSSVVLLSLPSLRPGATYTMYYNSTRIQQMFDDEAQLNPVPVGQRKKKETYASGVA